MSTTTSTDDPIGAIIDAACGWGWDRPSAPDADRADALLATNPQLAESSFLIACLAGEVESVRRALQAQPELARRPLPPRGWEPLLYVSFDLLARRGRPRAADLVAVARLLLSHGADPNARYTDASKAPNTFPALYATIAVSDNLDLARTLLAAGADPNDGQSLYHAAERFDTEALELLSEHGISPKEISYNLFHKIDFTDEAGVRWFLDHGADPSGRHPAEDETPLHWAVKRACAASVIALLLERGADPNARTRSGRTAYPAILGWTPLDLAERLGRLDMAALLHERGGQRGPVGPVDDLMTACARGDGATARRLLAEAPDLRQQLGTEDRALIAQLAQQDNTAGVELMVDLGFDPGAGGWGGLTPLHWAACRGNRPLLRALLARHVPLVDLGGDAGTPLHQALYQRWNRAGDYVGVLRDLVAAGVPLPPDLRPTGDAALDAAVAELRQGMTPRQSR